MFGISMYFDEFREVQALIYRWAGGELGIGKHGLVWPMKNLC
jgi:hypothetical protein